MENDIIFCSISEVSMLAMLLLLVVPKPVSCVGILWFWQNFYKTQRIQEILHYYSNIMLDSFASLLCSKLRRHNVVIPTYRWSVSCYSTCMRSVNVDRFCTWLERGGGSHDVEAMIMDQHVFQTFVFTMYYAPEGVPRLENLSREEIGRLLDWINCLLIILTDNVLSTFDHIYY